jgi:hypothetical protein
MVNEKQCDVVFLSEFVERDHIVVIIPIHIPASLIRTDILEHVDGDQNGIGVGSYEVSCSVSQLFF